MTSPTQRSATQLARMIRQRQISSSIVVEAFLERIAAVNPILNAVVELRAEKARAEARAADAALARGEAPGPLHGVPITVKESIAVSGMIWSGGTVGRAARVADESATVVSRLRAAGAIVLGTTNVPDMSFAYESDNLIYGRTTNPYDPSRTAGGSTGGEAAIIAAGGSPLGLGGDFLGSIRVPAHFCGIAGLRPNPGRVPGTGYFPSGGGLTGLLAQNGPLARRVEDLALALSAIAGPDGRDPTTAPVPLKSMRDVEPRGLKIAFYTDNGVSAATPETAAAVEEAARVLSNEGAIVEEARPPGAGEAFAMVASLFGADGGEGMRRLLAMEGSHEAHPLLAGALDIFSQQRATTAEFMGRWMRWDAWRGQMLRFMENYDAILSPVAAKPAMLHGTTLAGFADFSYSHIFTLSASPAVVVRSGTSPEGLPIGVQIVPKHWREDVALALGELIERANDWAAPALTSPAAAEAGDKRRVAAA